MGGGITALATIAIAWFTYSLRQSTERLKESGEKQIRAMQAIALQQDERTQEAIRVSNRSAAAAERAITDLERPWIFVFGVRVGDRGTEAQGWFVEYTVANYGKMPAIIDSAYVGFEISEKAEPPFPLEVSGDHSLAVSPILQGGERRTLKEYFPTQLDADVGATFRVLPSPEGDILEAVPDFKTDPGFDTFFRVIIYYHGPLSREHETAANWLYNPPFDFLLRGGDEYNCNK